MYTVAMKSYASLDKSWLQHTDLRYLQENLWATNLDIQVKSTAVAHIAQYWHQLREF